MMSLRLIELYWYNSDQTNFTMKQKVDCIPTALHGTMFTKCWNRLTKITFRKSRNENKTGSIGISGGR